MKKIKQKDLYIIIGVAIVAAIILLAAVSNNIKAPGDNFFNMPQGVQNENKPAESNQSTPATTSTSGSTSEPSMSYQDALRTFADRRFQFSFDYANDCVMSPSYAVFKSGAQIMLDNRSDKTMALSLDGSLINIKAYGFKIITLTSNQVPHVVNFNCDAKKNVGQILLQK